MPDTKGPPVYFIRKGPPVDGPGGHLAGVAEPGAQLHVQSGPHIGTYVNQGTKDAPIWRRYNEMIEAQQAARLAPQPAAPDALAARQAHRAELTRKVRERRR